MFNAICLFDDVTERDMDRLIAEELACCPEFINLFLQKIDISDVTVESVQLSKTDVLLGESDLTVIYLKGDTKRALLIEDKIDARAMPEQFSRYQKRGLLGIDKNEYSAFDIFIVAPKQYLENNEEAQKYPFRVSYEEMADFFLSRNDARSKFKYQQTMQAINKQKSGYQAIVNEAVTDFWDNYIAYQKEYYPTINLISKSGGRGSKASWPRYATDFSDIFIYHKMEFGFIDMTFKNAAEKIEEIEDLLEQTLGNLFAQDLTVHKTNKSCVLRIKVPKLDTTQSFDSQEVDIKTCFDAISRMYELYRKIDLKHIRRIIC